MLDAQPESELYAKKGEAVCCVNGHVICEIARDIHKGDARGPNDLTNWAQPEPDQSKSVADIKCIECRGVWVRGSNRGGYQFHFPEGWR